MTTMPSPTSSQPLPPTQPALPTTSLRRGRDPATFAHRGTKARGGNAGPALSVKARLVLCWGGRDRRALVWAIVMRRRSPARPLACSPRFTHSSSPDRGGGGAQRGRAPRRLIFEDDVQSVDDARDVTKNRQEHVDAKVGAEAALECDAERRQHDGADDLDDVATGERHGC
jgi:hypothetical protein